MQSAIVVDKLNITINKHKILMDISVGIPAGKIVGVIGPSGSGKTTLMRAIVGRQRLSSGSVKVLDLPAGSAELRCKIGYMAQSSAVYPDLSVKDNVRYFAKLLGAPKTDADRVLKTVALQQKENQVFNSLSGGEKARTSLAIALLGKPEVLVLDEPTVGLDPVLRQKLWDTFRVFASSGVTILVSSHVMDEAARCDSLILLRGGRVLATGTPLELQKQTHTKTTEQSFLALVSKGAEE